MKNFVLTVILSILPTLCFANLCEELSGQWQGNWMMDGTTYDASIIFNESPKNDETKQEQQFSGKFNLSNGSSGEIAGVCKTQSSTEAILQLDPESPLFNPCRGFVIFHNNKLLSHFFCFAPNQSGYFEKK